MFLFECARHHLNLHSFPTRRSSDLETIREIKRGDLVKFHREHYGPRGMVIAIVGGVKPEDAVKQVKRALGGWQNKHQKKDRKSTRLNSSHGYISYAVFCLKKKKKTK